MACAACCENSEGVRELHEVLLSTEYGASGAPRGSGSRCIEEPDGYALRGAGDANARAGRDRVGRHGGARSRSLDFRLDGEDGAAVYEIWHRA